MPQEFKHPRDVLAYRAFYVLRRPWGSASASEGETTGSGQRLGVAPRWRVPSGDTSSGCAGSPEVKRMSFGEQGADFFQKGPHSNY